MKRYHLICIAPDGDYVVDAFDVTYDECVKRSENMGSKWFFYPFHVITTLSGKTVAGAFGDLEPFIGKRLTTLEKAIASGAFDYLLEG